MECIEEWKQEELSGVLPKNSYARLGKDALLDLLRDEQEDTLHPHWNYGIAR